MQRRTLVLLQAWLAAWLLCAAFPGLADRLPRARQGVIEVPAAPANPVPLDGEWGFVWEKFVRPDWQSVPATAFAPVPSSWNELTAEGKPEGENGWGSYVLQVNCPVGQNLAVEVFGQRTASRLFVNGDLVAAHGNPGPSGERSYAAVFKRNPISREFACPLRLTLHISNFDHRAGGFVRPLFVAPAPVLERERELRIMYAAVLQAAYLLTGFAALAFFAVRRRETTPLVYGLFCVAMAAYADSIGERVLLRLLPEPLSWVAYMRLEYWSWLAAMALFLLTLRSLFPEEVSRRVVIAVEAALAAAGLGVLLLPPGVYSHLAMPGQFVAVVVAAYVATAMLRARKRAPVDARILLAGLIAVLVALCVDLLLIDTPSPDRKLVPTGFALFLLSPAFVIARRLTRSLNAEERAQQLEENARLREDVERISRHDLKTPLNSILGATRLLREDPQVGPAQQELVGVLQRAGLRMLEMVNLSLGLYKMETGAYELQPRAVDLKQVTQAVIRDLQSLADTSRVDVRFQPAPAMGTVALGEELLCYSIVANLLKNAIEAVQAGARIDLILSQDEVSVGLSIRNPGEVPPEIADRFFEKYVTGRKSGGTGLGTYSARLMARAQHGDLTMSTGPEGTAVTLRLPRHRGDQAAVARPPEPRRDLSLLDAVPTRSVLVVDDDELNRLVTRRMLPAPPFEIRTAINGQAATQAMLQQWPDYLIVDMEMPVMDGIETVTWMRSHEAQHGLARCGVVMLSGNDDEESIQRARAAGVDRYLTKPVSRRALLSALHDLEAPSAAPPLKPAAAAAPAHPDPPA